VRTVSPRINLLESTEAFADGVAAYHTAGFRDIYLPWPRTEREVPVLRQVAREVIPELRGQTRSADAVGQPTRPMNDLVASDEEVVANAY
jgi:hypothetical protein